MHESSARRIERFIQLHVIPWVATVPSDRQFVVLDVGAADPGIRYKQLFVKGYPFFGGLSWLG